MSIELAIGISLLWGAVSLPLTWLNPLKFSNDEFATKILVYAVAPFIFFSVVFFVIGAVKSMRRTRGQNRDSLRLRLADTARSLEAYAQNDPAGNKNFKAFVEGIIKEAGQAIESGKHIVAEERLQKAEDAIGTRRLNELKR